MSDDRSFGDGEAYGDRSFTPPVHGTTSDGDPVTVSFGQGSREGETLISRGHVETREGFYDKQEDGGKGHDHYGQDGSTGKHGDRGRWW